MMYKIYSPVNPVTVNLYCVLIIMIVFIEVGGDTAQEWLLMSPFFTCPLEIELFVFQIKETTY